MRLNIFSYVNCFWNSSLANLSSNPKSPLLNLRSNYYNSDVELKIKKKTWNSSLANSSSMLLKI